MVSARAAVARAARGRLWNHGRRQLDGQLRAAGEALGLRMALRLLRATAAPASTTSLPNIAFHRAKKVKKQNSTGRRDLGVGARGN